MQEYPSRLKHTMHNHWVYHERQSHKYVYMQKASLRGLVRGDKYFCATADSQTQQTRRG